MSRNTDTDLTELLRSVKTIAVVGWSPNPGRASNSVARFLATHGYRVVPVNPGHAGKKVLGETVVAHLSDIDGTVDMVDIFRRSEKAGEVVDDALQYLDGLQAVWMQLGVVDDAAADRARAAGVKVVMDRCPAIEIPRLGL
ncbi:MAG: CoA-binding protein [Celeribacter sp.]|jgi:predicted CoA-binding protein